MYQVQYRIDSVDTVVLVRIVGIPTVFSTSTTGEWSVVRSVVFAIALRRESRDDSEGVISVMDSEGE